MITSQGKAIHVSHLLGPHPIIAHFLERLRLQEIVHKCVGTGKEALVSHGEALAVLVHNVLDSPAPLYRIANWAEPVDPPAMGLTVAKKNALNDDRMARMLDALVSDRGKGIWFLLALEMIRAFGIAKDRMHHDTTTVTFRGEYRGSVTHPRITYGHNKDHRPDLKQMVFGLTVSADGAVPLTHQVMSGNQSDERVHLGNVEELKHLLGREDFIYVADCKLATSKNLREISEHGGKFVTVLPRTRQEDKTFRKQLRDKGVRWKQIWQVENKRQRGGSPDRFASCGEGGKTVEGYRLIWIRSSAKAAHDREERERALEKTQEALTLLSQRINKRRLRRARIIRKAVRSILEAREMASYVQVTLQRQTEKVVHHLKRGRPGPSDPVRVSRKLRFRLVIRRNKEALRSAKRTDGVFPLVTNLGVSFPKREVLSIYKYQPYIEKRFSQLKTDLGVAPVYLKRPLRAAGLIHVYYVALAVASLIERAVRQGMARGGITHLPLFPEGRHTATPTCPRILEAFQGVTWYEFKRGSEIVCFPLKLNKVQKLLLKLLGIPTTRYA